MTEETAEVPQLDYSKPPPGFRISGPPSHSEHTQAAIRDAWAYYKTDNDPPGFLVTGDEAADDGSGGNAAWLLPERVLLAGDGYHGGYATTSSARTAAWAWYDRRLALAAKLDVALIVDEEPFKGRIIRTVVPAGEARHFDGEQRPYAAWPRILTWSYDQVAEVERWLADSTAEIPEVLRG